MFVAINWIEVNYYCSALGSLSKIGTTTVASTVRIVDVTTELAKLYRIHFYYQFRPGHQARIRERMWREQAHYLLVLVLLLLHKEIDWHPQLRLSARQFNRKQSRYRNRFTQFYNRYRSATRSTSSWQARHGNDASLNRMIEMFVLRRLCTGNECTNENVMKTKMVYRWQLLSFCISSFVVDAINAPPHDTV